MSHVCLIKWEKNLLLMKAGKYKRRDAMWHVPHHPPFLEVFEKDCADCAGGVGGTGCARGAACRWCIKKKLKLKKLSEGEGTIRGHQMCHT